MKCLNQCFWKMNFNASDVVKVIVVEVECGGP